MVVDGVEVSRLFPTGSPTSLDKILPDLAGGLALVVVVRMVVVESGAFVMVVPSVVTPTSVVLGSTGVVLSVVSADVVSRLLSSPTLLAMVTVLNRLSSVTELNRSLAEKMDTLPGLTWNIGTVGPAVDSPAEAKSVVVVNGMLDVVSAVAGVVVSICVRVEDSVFTSVTAGVVEVVRGVVFTTREVAVETSVKRGCSPSNGTASMGS